VQLLNTLYVNQPDSHLRLDNSTLEVAIDREVKLRVPLHHLSGVVCFGPVGVSTPLMQRLCEAGISLVLLDFNGRFRGRLEGPTSGNVLLRLAQFKQVDSRVFALETARAFIAGKIRNCRQSLLRGAREAKSEEEGARLTRGAEDLAGSLRALPAVAGLDALRGGEGEAARQYFECLNLIVRQDSREHFAMDGRTRRPPRDNMNALMSFLYSMLMNDCRSAVESVGLDPQLGFLHAVRPGRAALALDLMEEFRPLADRLALTLINRGQLSPKDFETREGGAVSLKPDGRKTVVVAYQERKQETLTHPLLAEAIALGLVPFVQARLLARAIRGDTPGYVPFVIK
jgi:CRISPR-associated protein Cas1